MHTVQVGLSNLHYTLYNEECTLYTVRCTLYTLHCTLFTVYMYIHAYLTRYRFSDITRPKERGRGRERGRERDRGRGGIYRYISLCDMCGYGERLEWSRDACRDSITARIQGPVMCGRGIWVTSCRHAPSGLNTQFNHMIMWWCEWEKYLTNLIIICFYASGIFVKMLSYIYIMRIMFIYNICICKLYHFTLYYIYI